MNMTQNVTMKTVSIARERRAKSLKRYWTSSKISHLRNNQAITYKSIIKRKTKHP